MHVILFETLKLLLFFFKDLKHCINVYIYVCIYLCLMCTALNDKIEL